MLLPKAKHFRREQRREGGYNLVPAYSEEEVRAIVLEQVKAAVPLAARAGWSAALACHSRHGMAGWSLYRDQYLKEIQDATD